MSPETAKGKVDDLGLFLSLGHDRKKGSKVHGARNHTLCSPTDVGA